MNKKLEQILEQLIPFIILGIAIALSVGLFIMFSYVLVWGIIIGALIWVASLIKNYFFEKTGGKDNKGRIIEHEDSKKDE